ncbi:MAG TPA: GNAT family N-acetyltransferase [Roseiflexaceae bacterium]|nr:GNAT family N-acetyltransferase [Roseiflexaceae bacterium]
MPLTTEGILVGFQFQTHDGQAYALRRVMPTDTERLYDLMRGLSERTRWRRFMTRRPFSDDVARLEVRRVLAGSTDGHVTLLVTEMHGATEVAVALAELACDRSSDTGEIAVVVRDDCQRKGIGSFLLRQLVRIAHEGDLTYLRADLFADNYPMRRLLQALRLHSTTTSHRGELSWVARLPPRETLFAYTLVEAD